MHTTIKTFPFFALALLVTCIHATPDEELILAARSNDTGGVIRALQRGAHPDARDMLSQTALHCAAHYNNAEIAQIMLHSSANKEAVNFFGMVPLHLAAFHNSREVAAVLLGAGAQNSQEFNGITPLEIAFHLGHRKIVQLIAIKLTCREKPLA